MSTIYDGAVKLKDENGNTFILLPITRVKM